MIHVSPISALLIPQEAELLLVHLLISLVSCEVEDSLGMALS